MKRRKMLTRTSTVMIVNVAINELITRIVITKVITRVVITYVWTKMLPRS